MSSFGGAYDLSKLKKTEPVVGSEQATQVAIPSLIFDCTEQNLRDILQISARVPVVFEFHADSRQRFDFSNVLAEKIRSYSGRLVLARVDAQEAPRVATAFSITGVPTVLAVLKGQPVPLFEGQADEQTLVKVFEQLLAVASENGVTGSAVEDSDAPAVSAGTPALPPKHQEAYDAIGRLDFDAAIAAYQAALNENPGDQMAHSGLAQVKLMARTIDIDPASLSIEPPAELYQLKLWADVQTSIGHYSVAFDALLDAYERNAELRAEIHKHLLELFTVVDANSPDLANARRRLASLMF